MTLREILCQLHDGKYVYTDPRVKVKKIDQAISDIQKLLPKKKERRPKLDRGGLTVEFAWKHFGYNQAINDMKERLK